MPALLDVLVGALVGDGLCLLGEGVCLLVGSCLPSMMTGPCHPPYD